MRQLQFGSFLAGAAILAFSIGGALLAQDRPPAVGPPAEAPPTTQPTTAQVRLRTATAAIERELDQDTSIDVIEVELGQIIRDIARQHKLTIVVDPIGLEIAGVTSDQLISLELQNISLRSALRILLRPMQLTFVIRNETLLITSLDCPERLATVRTFPLGDLLKRVDDPTQIVSTLEMVWPDDDRIDRQTTCKPRASIVADHLVVRGSPRHHELAEELIESLEAGQTPSGINEPAKAEEPTSNVRDRVELYVKALLTRYDANENGTLEGDEIGKLTTPLQAADKNQDGVITLEELKGKLVPPTAQPPAAKPAPSTDNDPFD